MTDCQDCKTRAMGVPIYSANCKKCASDMANSQDKVCTRCGKEGHRASQCKVRCMECGHSTLKKSGLSSCAKRPTKWRLFSPVFLRECAHYVPATSERQERFRVELVRMGAAL